MILSVIFVLLLVWIICLSYLYKGQLSNMVGMVVSMTIGMIVGLSIGTLLAVLYPHSFFEVTVISMLIGSILGVLTGLPFSLVAIIDGLMSGIMGGMMGAMLGVMISPENHNQLLNIMSLWTVGVFFLTYLLQVSEINKIGKNNNLFLKPLTYFIVVCIFIYSFTNYTFEPTTNNLNHHTPDGHYHELFINED